MTNLCAQGDILIERVENHPSSDRMVQAVDGGSMVFAEGEATEHHHRIVGMVALYRDDALARDIPDGLYQGHVSVNGLSAHLKHEEHAPLTLEQGLYRIRRQRQLEPTDVGLLEDFSVLGD